MENAIEPHHIEITNDRGGSKWLRGVVSHTAEEIREAMKENEILHLKDCDGGEAVVDMERVFMIRFQNEEVFQRRMKELKQENVRRRRS